jgi:hypothetical protein
VKSKENRIQGRSIAGGRLIMLPFYSNGLLACIVDAVSSACCCCLHRRAAACLFIYFFFFLRGTLHLLKHVLVSCLLPLFHSVSLQHSDNVPTLPHSPPMPFSRVFVTFLIWCCFYLRLADFAEALSSLYIYLVDFFFFFAAAQQRTHTHTHTSIRICVGDTPIRVSFHLFNALQRRVRRGNARKERRANKSRKTRCLK